MLNTRSTVLGTLLLIGAVACSGGGTTNPAAPSNVASTASSQPSTAVSLATVTSNQSADAITNDISGDTMPWVYSELWSNSSPFKRTVSAQKAAGAVAVVSHSWMDALWSQGIAGNGTAQSIPIYVASSSDPLLTAVCTMYGGNCNAKNVQIHVPSYAIAQQSNDGHMTVIDQHAPSGAIELDCWQTSVYQSTIYCSWAGVFPLGGSGMTPNGSAGIHGGMAVTTVYATAREIVLGHIDHALGLTVRCLNNSTIYPAWTASGTDTSCDGSYNAPHYGNLVHLLWSPTQIKQSAYSAPCKVVLNALAKYGAYLDDTGDNGMQIDTQNELSYTADSGTKGLDPWPGIQSELNAAGDGTGSAWYSCLNRLSSSNFELLQVSPT